MTRHRFDLDPSDPRVPQLTALYAERYGDLRTLRRERRKPHRCPSNDATDQRAGWHRQTVLLDALNAYEARA